MDDDDDMMMMLMTMLYCYEEFEPANFENLKISSPQMHLALYNCQSDARMSAHLVVSLFDS